MGTRGNGLRVWQYTLCGFIHACYDRVFVFGVSAIIKRDKMPIGIRAMNDFAFKKIFGTSVKKRALISLLNAVLQLSESDEVVFAGKTLEELRVETTVLQEQLRNRKLS